MSPVCRGSLTVALHQIMIASRIVKDRERNRLQLHRLPLRDVIGT